MPLTSAAVTVADAATALHTASGNPIRLVVYNNDASATMFVGGSAVVTTTGIPVAAGKSLSMLLNGGEIAFGIVAAGTVNARVVVSAQ